MALNKITDVLYGYPDWHATELSYFEEWVQKQQQASITIFRGQRRAWPLLPSITRACANSQLLKTERELILTFRKEAERCLHLLPSTDWDWIVVAQHHGIPTRVLDWSYDPLVALWFALEKHTKASDSAPEVWVLKPLAEDVLAPKELKHSNPFSGTRTKVFETNFMLPRVRAQQSCFTLFKHIEKKQKGFVPLEENVYLRKSLERIRIPPYACKRVLLALKNKGYCRDALYPNIDKIAGSIKKRILATGFSI
ncbi:MAG: FRG domain-containing protein [Victivallales bacterium]|jgi:hypothetical protein